MLRLASLIFLISYTTPSSAASAELFSHAQKQKIAHSTEWKKLLFYTPKLWTGPRSIFDTPETFLTVDGASNPEHELEAQLKGMFEPLSAKSDQEKHALCRFPARSKFLIKALNINRADLPTPDCKILREWRQAYQVNGVSLVFSSYYTNNPASMFGHTFLELHRVENARATSRLLNLAANYAAQVGAPDGFDYYIKGLLGQFPGRYNILPMYVKVQEYNNFEQRDLWHYKLNFSEDDIDQLINILWELEKSAAGYFYFDENCSLVVLMTLDAAKPNLHLYENLRYPWILPSDTLHATYQSPGLVTDVAFTASTRTRFENRYGDLSSEQKDLVEEILEENNFAKSKPRLEKLPTNEQARILDALTELMDFKEDIAGASLGDVYKVLRKDTLMYRASLDAKINYHDDTPRSDAPHTSHMSSRFGLGLGHDSLSEQNFVNLDWRPALHDLLDNSDGFPQGLKIEFMNMQFAYDIDDEKLRLRDLGVFRVQSLPTGERVIRSFAWQLETGLQERRTCSQDRKERCLVTYLGGGFGDALSFFDEGMILYGMLTPRVDLVHDGVQKAAFTGGILTGALIHPSKHTALYADYALGREFTLYDKAPVRRFNLGASIQPSRNSALRLEGTSDGKEFSAAIKAYYHY